jgi:PAS domain S-box-containing protein
MSAGGWVKSVLYRLMIPAIRLMNRLSYARKFAVISFLFILPLALNQYLLRSEIDKRVQFARREVLGNVYLRPLRALQIMVQEDLFAPETAACMDDLRRVDGEFGSIFGTGELIETVEETWRRVQAAADPFEAEADRQQLLTNLRALRLQVGDASNLILDPDLDTYYLMDATLLKLPEVERVLGDLLLDTRRGDERWIAAARTDLIRTGGRLKTASAEIRHGYTVAAKNNPRQSIGPRLGLAVQRYVEATDSLVAALDAATAEAGQRGGREELIHEATAVQVASRALWTQSVDELDDLLRLRVARLEAKERLVYVVAACTLALVAYLLLAFYLAVADTVKGLDIATQRLLTDDFNAPINLDARDELGHLVHAFDGLARRLRDEWSQARAETTRAVEAERRVRESEARNHLILESALDAVVTLNSAGEITWWNGQAERMFGWIDAEPHGQSLASLIVVPREFGVAGGAGFAQRLTAVGARAPDQRIEAAARRRDGQEFPIELAITMAEPGSDCAFSVFIHDITRRKKLEVELRQAQKLESVGRLAAGVAHEINTPVQFVSDNMHFLRSGIDDLAGVVIKYRELHHAVSGGGPLLELAAVAEQAEHDADLEYLLENMPTAVDRVLEGLERVATIVRSMKEFAHPDLKEMSAVDLNQAIQSTLVIARHEYKYVADVETDLGDLPRVTCHPGDVNQAILNIVVNAAHAIGDVVAGTAARGRITIRTRREGSWAEVRITDTGGGIPEDIRDRIFDPFFTTKEVGRGSGQGLAISRAVILEKHGGTLTFETEMGVGTTFVIRLPVDGRAGDVAIEDAA